MKFGISDKYKEIDFDVVAVEEVDVMAGSSAGAPWGGIVILSDNVEDGDGGDKEALMVGDIEEQS